MDSWKTLAILSLAAAAPWAASAAEVPAMPAATVEANSVAHAGEGVTVRVPQSATYVGSERFNLYGVADAEVHVFVEPAADKRMGRLYWIQFESYLPSKPDLSYDYSDNHRTQLWGTTTWLGGGPASTSAPTRAGSDRQHVIGILERAGYAIPPEVMNVRMVQMLDDPQGTGKGRRELMIIYSEDLALAGTTLAEVTNDGEPNERWTALQQPLIERATSAITVERR